MKTRFIQAIFFVSITVFLGSFHLVSAQFTENGTAQSVLVTVTPEHPHAHETVNFKVTSFLSNLDTATISWFVNGTRVAGDAGMRTFSTTLGNIGTPVTVKVVVTTAEGETITQSFPFISSTVDLVWEANSFTPPLYRGKALLTARESARVVAVPHLSANSSSLSPSNFIYTWSRDGRIVGDASGVGRSTFILTNDMTISPSTISVVVSNKDQSVNAEGSVVINLADPKVLTYFNTGTLGTLYNRALSGIYTFGIKEVNIVAVPYFFNTTDSTLPYVNYTWTMNNRPLDVFENMLTIRNVATSTGISTISTTAAVTSGASNQSDTTSFSLKF